MYFQSQIMSDLCFLEEKQGKQNSQIYLNKELVWFQQETTLVDQ